MVMGILVSSQEEMRPLSPPHEYELGDNYNTAGVMRPHIQGSGLGLHRLVALRLCFLGYMLSEPGSNGARKRSRLCAETG